MSKRNLPESNKEVISSIAQIDNIANECAGCNLKIQNFMQPDNCSLEEYSRLFHENKDAYSTNLSYFSVIKCSCNKMFCYNCCFIHLSSGQTEHNFKDQSAFFDIPGKSQFLEFAREQYILGYLRKEFVIYQQTPKNCLRDEIIYSMNALISGENSILSQKIDINNFYILLIEKLFQAGYSKSAIEYLSKIISPCVEMRIKIIELIINYLGISYIKKHNYLKNDIKELCNARISRIYFIRFSIIISFCDGAIPLEQLERYEQSYKEELARENGTDLDKYNYIYDMGIIGCYFKQIQYIERYIHYCHIYFQHSIMLANAYKYLSNYYKKLKQYNEAMNYLEISIEIYLKNIDNESPDIIKILCKLAKLKIKFNLCEAENLLILALNICEKNHLREETLKTCKLLKIFYYLSYESERVKFIKNYIKNIGTT